MHESEKSLILVTGATGAVGPRLVAALHEKGYRIRTLSLDPPQSDEFPPHVEFLLGDVTNTADVESAMQGAHAVVHLAALLHIVNPALEMEQKFREINVGGTEVVARIAMKVNVKRLVYFSTIAVYGKSDFKLLDENAPTNPVTFYEKTKLAAEDIVLHAKNENGIPIGTVLRLAAVYGSRIKGNYRRLLEALDKNRFIPIGSGLNRRTLVYDKDVAHAALLALEHPNAVGKVFNVSDGEFHTLDEIIKTICQSLGRRPPVFSLPVGFVRPFVGIMEDLAKLCSLKPPVMRSSIDKYTEDIAVESNRIQKELGFAPKYDLLAGWADTVKEMREIGNIRS